MAQVPGRVRIKKFAEDGNKYIMPGQEGVVQKVTSDDKATVRFDWLLMPVTVDRSPQPNIDASVPLDALEAI